MKKLILALALLPSMACAAEIDFSAVLYNVDGSVFGDCVVVEQLPAPHCTKTESMTLGHLSAGALNVRDQHDTLSQITEKGLLAERVYGGGKQGMTVEQIKLIKDSLAKTAYPPIEITAAVRILDPDSLKLK